MKSPKTFDRPIAWVCRTVEEAGKTEVIVEREGMTREEMKAHFPPITNNNGNIDFDRKGLIKAIIYEAYREAVDLGKNRPRQNIRGFWYERIMYTLINIIGELGDAENINSIETSINAAWKDLVEAGNVTYTELNLYSEKETILKIE